MHASVNEIRTTVEKQAKELMRRPEEVLMQSVRSTSQGVIDNLNALKERGTQVTKHFVACEMRLFLSLCRLFKDDVSQA